MNSKIKSTSFMTNITPGLSASSALDIFSYRTNYSQLVQQQSQGRLVKEDDNNRRQDGKYWSQMPGRREEFRARRKREVDEIIAGRDLVPWALQHPEDFKSSVTLQNALFGRHYWSHDEMDMVFDITKRAATTSHGVSTTAAYPDEAWFLKNINLWKLAYCDSSIVADDQELASLYISRLRDEELQPPEERARELVRSEAEKTARRNAKWMIPEVEKLAISPRDVLVSRGERKAMLALWQRVSPPPPRWIQVIVDNGQPWGFVSYRSAETQRDYGAKWAETWEEVKCDIDMSSFGERRPFLLESIHQGGRGDELCDLLTETWPQDESDLGLENDEAILK